MAAGWSHAWTIPAVWCIKIVEQKKKPDKGLAAIRKGGDTFASNALNTGMDITIIQHLLGHTDPKTTLIYAELAPWTVKYE